MNTAELKLKILFFTSPLVSQRSILRRTTAETLMETPDPGASPPAHPKDGTSAPFPAAVSHPALIICPLYFLSVSSLERLQTRTMISNV